MIAENLSTSVVQELSTLVKQLKDDRRKVKYYLLFCTQYYFSSEMSRYRTFLKYVVKWQDGYSS